MVGYAILSYVSQPLLRWLAAQSNHALADTLPTALFAIEYLALLVLPLALIAIAAVGDSFWGPALMYSVGYLAALVIAIARCKNEGAMIYMLQLPLVLWVPPIAVLVRLIRAVFF